MQDYGSYGGGGGSRIAGGGAGDPYFRTPTAVPQQGGQYFWTTSTDGGIASGGHGGGGERFGDPNQTNFQTQYVPHNGAANNSYNYGNLVGNNNLDFSNRHQYSYQPK